MVLAVKVGRPRSFWMVLGLSVATFGVYWFYWAYRSHDELYRQFELAREGRDEGVVWLVFGNFLPFLRYIYYYRFVSNTHHLRQRFGHPHSLTPGRFLGLSLTAGATFTALALPGLILATNAFRMVTNADGTQELELHSPTLLAVAYAFLGFAAAQWFVLKAVALHRLQGDVNGIWQAYDQRAAHLRAPRPSAVGRNAAPVGPRPGAPAQPATRAPARPAPPRP